MSIKTSEWVSVGHPDKTADYISSYILDRYLEKDPNVRYALEVMIKDNSVILGGEITSTITYTNNDLYKFVIQALAEIGYTKDYYNKWNNHTINPEQIFLTSIISQQSPNIAQGVDNDGWGDQGIFFGYAENTDTYMSKDYSLAKYLGQYLYYNAKTRNEGGLDIKTQVTYDDTSNTVMEVIVAIPCKNDEEYNIIENNVKKWINDIHLMYKVKDTKIIINGTGLYITHSSIGDCGITGRKLAVDFYGGNCKIGGGSPWTKDPSKADLTLNLLMRKLAIQDLKSKLDKGLTQLYKVVTNTHSCIGRNNLMITYTGYDKEDNVLYVNNELNHCTATEIINDLNLKQPIYSDLCMNGLFSKI